MFIGAWTTSGSQNLEEHDDCILKMIYGLTIDDENCISKYSPESIPYLAMLAGYRLKERYKVHSFIFVHVMAP